ncbi:uncharacterized protein LOC124935742 [Impatiens glandulifera]|uniref:uncharacterized protein LOC124935742 n=1 Tax=Impatiens glandulifera TaxID=253017 RepID=UPI001FB0A1A3|nr:uncharacterized protein LOC124935742 [Impatiens glandulifera]
MELFQNAKAVRLRSSHGKYLHANEDDDSVTQDKDGSSKSSRWTVEFIPNSDNAIRLKSFYGKYLTASNMPFLLGMTGRKVLHTLPPRLDSSIEWEPIKDGNQAKLRTRYGQFLRANGGLPPWRNSVTHDVPHRSSTQDWIFWDVHVMEILVVNSPKVAAPTPTPAAKRQESGVATAAKGGGDGRTIYFKVADDLGNVEEGGEEMNIVFRGNGVDELSRRLEEETGIEDIIVCSKNPLNGKLFPLMLQLPPRSVTMHLVLVPADSKVGRDFEKAGMVL